MEKLKLDNLEFIKLLEFATLDTSLNVKDFRVLCYVHFNDNFTQQKLSKDLKISSLGIVISSLKKLEKLEYIEKVSKHTKKIKNVSSYNYLVLTKNLNVHKNHNNSIKSYFKDTSSLYNYFFELIPTSKKIAYFENYKAVDLLLNYDKFTFEQIKTIIDFISENEELKKKYNRPILLRKDIQQLISLTRINKGA